MRTNLHHLSLIQDYNHISLQDGGQPMRNNCIERKGYKIVKKGATNKVIYLTNCGFSSL